MINTIDLDHPDWQIATTFAVEPKRKITSTKRSIRLWLRQRRPVFVALLSAVITVLVVASLALGSTYLDNNSVDQQSQAAILGSATVDWPSQNLQLPAGQMTRLALTSNPGAAVIDGVQVIVNISGTNLPSMQFFPNSGLSGLEVAASTLTPTSTGQLLQVALISQQPEQGYAATNQAISLGELVFTPANGAQVKLTFDGSTTAVLEHGSGQNLVGTLVNPTYGFQLPPSPTPVPTPSPSPSPVPSPSVVPSPVISPAPTASPVASVIPTPIPSPIPSPVPSPTPVPTPEVVVVNSAVLTKYRFGLAKLTVNVSDSLAPNVSLSVNGFGKLSYNRKTNRYTGTWYTLQTNLSAITITSSTGKEVVAPVQQKLSQLRLFR